LQHSTEFYFLIFENRSYFRKKNHKYTIFGKKQLNFFHKYTIFGEKTICLRGAWVLHISLFFFLPAGRWGGWFVGVPAARASNGKAD
jgi:hypothetical protein